MNAIIVFKSEPRYAHVNDQGITKLIFTSRILERSVTQSIVVPADVMSVLGQRQRLRRGSHIRWLTKRRKILIRINEYIYSALR
jgi:hypothetical protein